MNSGDLIQRPGRRERGSKGEQEGRERRREEGGDGEKKGRREGWGNMHITGLQMSKDRSTEGSGGTAAGRAARG